MPASIDPAVQEKLNSGVDLIAVEIEFSEAPSEKELQASGLRAEGKVAWGKLSREKILAIASLPQTRIIRLSSRSVTPAPSAQPGSKVGPRLQQALKDVERKTFDVIVTFRRPSPSLPPIPGLSIHLDMGNGRLSREAISTLAKQDDVLSIELSPEFELHSK